MDCTLSNRVEDCHEMGGQRNSTIFTSIVQDVYTDVRCRVRRGVVRPSGDLSLFSSALFFSLFLFRMNPVDVTEHLCNDVAKEKPAVAPRVVTGSFFPVPGVSVSGFLFSTLETYVVPSSTDDTDVIGIRKRTLLLFICSCPGAVHCFPIVNHESCHLIIPAQRFLSSFSFVV